MSGKYALQVDLQRLMGEVSLGSSPSIGPGMSSSPSMAGLGSTTSMGSAPTPRNLMAANAFASAQGLHNRNLSDLGSYLELLSLSRGQEQVLIILTFQSLCQDMQMPKVAAAAKGIDCNTPTDLLLYMVCC